MQAMTGRERVRAALEHREADRVPIDFGGMRSTGISAIGYNKLRSFLGLGQETRVYDLFQQLAEPELEILQRFGGDVLQLHRYRPAFGIDLTAWKDGVLPDGSSCRYPAGFNPVRTPDGGFEIIIDGKAVARMPAGGLYFDQIVHPYQACTSPGDIEAIPIHAMAEDEMVWLRKEAARLKATDYAVLGAFGGNILEAGQADWGYENFFMNLALEPDLVHHYLNRITDAYMADLEKYLAAVGDTIDVIQFGDDLGTQEAPQISTEMYRTMIMPYHKRQFDFVHRNYPRVKVFFHSCGSVRPLIPSLIEAGVDVLNPVQLSARGMDPVELKREFGKDLVFWGGGVDTQVTVTQGSLEDIRRSVKELVGIFAPGGGFVFTQVHNIQANVEPAKVVAIYDTALACGTYPVQRR